MATRADQDTLKPINPANVTTNRYQSHEEARLGQLEVLTTGLSSAPLLLDARLIAPINVKLLPDMNMFNLCHIVFAPSISARSIPTPKTSMRLIDARQHHLIVRPQSALESSLVFVLAAGYRVDCIRGARGHAASG